MHKPYETTIEVKDSVVSEIVPDFIPDYREIEISFEEHSTAEIWIDGTRMGTSVWKGKLENGPHVIEGIAANCTKSRVEIEVNPYTLQALKLSNPKPIMGKLIVNCNVSDATVYIDGVEIGKTGEYLDVQIGQRKLSVAQDGYETINRTIDIKNSGDNNINLSLSNIKAGSLSITSTPAAARIQIDGVDYGVAPKYLHSISTGPHKVTATLDGYKKTTKTVVIQGGSHSTINLTLEKKTEVQKNTSYNTASTAYGSYSSSNTYEVENPKKKFGIYVLGGYTAYEGELLSGVGIIRRNRFLQYGVEWMYMYSDEYDAYWLIGCPLAVNINILPKRFSWSPYIGVGYYPCLEYGEDWYSYVLGQAGLNFRHFDLNCRYLFNSDDWNISFGLTYYF